MQKFAEKPKGKDLDAMKVDTTVLGTNVLHRSRQTCVLTACLLINACNKTLHGRLQMHLAEVA